MKSPARRPARGRAAALAQYSRRARHYDAELALFEPLRTEAVALLALQKDQRPLQFHQHTTLVGGIDLACGVVGLRG